MTDDEPTPIPRKTPKKKEGPSMREQILARRREGDAGEAKAPAPEKAAAAPKKAAAGATRKTAGARPTSRTSARRAGGSSRRRGGDDADADEDGKAPRAGARARRERPVKKKSPVPIIAAAILAIGGGIGIFFAMTGGSTEAAEGDDTQTTDTSSADAADATSADETTTDGVADETTGTDDATAADAATEEVAKPKPAPAKVTDVDLSILEPFGKPLGATDEEWAKLQEDAAMFFDIDAGAAGGRAQRRLEAAGQHAWPAILNRMIKLDPAISDDNQLGMLGQRSLNAARGSDTSMAFDWRTPDDSSTGKLSDKNLRYNRKLIKALYDSWAAVVKDPKHWERLDKVEAQAEAQASQEKKVEDEFDVDDFDVDDID